jgi:hypothetical protein
MTLEYRPREASTSHAIQVRDKLKRLASDQESLEGEALYCWSRVEYLQVHMPTRLDMIDGYLGMAHDAEEAAHAVALERKRQLASLVDILIS